MLISPNMDCALCGWPAKKQQEWEAHGLLCAIWSCKTCECTMTAQTPLHIVKAFKKSPKDVINGGKKNGKAKTGSD